MRRTAAAMLKLAARIVTTLLVLALLVAGAVYVASESSFSRHLLLPQDALAVDLSHGDVTRGRHLALAVSECLNCHGSSGGGTLFNHDFEFGRLYAPNLTRGRGGAAATFSDTDWVAAIRYGLAPDGRRLFIMPSRAFAELSDGDLADIVTYLRSIPPVDAALPAPRYGPLARVLVLTHSIHFAADDIGRDAPAHDAVTPGVTVAYGAYLTRAGSCFQCHG